MKRLVGLLVAFQIACGGGAKTTKVVERRPIAVVVEANGPLLWQVDGPNGPVFLYGTIHTGGRDLVPQVAFDKLATTKTFVMEMDLDGIPAMEMAKRGMLGAGPSLEDQLGAELWEKLLAGVHGMVPNAALRRFKPWLAGVMLIQAAIGNDSEPTDKALLGDAKQAGEKLEYLETWQQQVDTLEQALDLAALKEMLVHLDELGPGMVQLVEAYKAGDAAAIGRLSADPSQTTPQQFDVMIKRRNENWLPRIEAYAAAGQVFVAVGAAHLVGADGVVQLLREQGYTVTRVAAP